MSFTSQRKFDSSSLGTNSKIHTPGATDLPTNVKGVYFDADCTFDWMNGDNSTGTAHPAKGGVLLYFVPKRITAVSGSVVCRLLS